MNIKLFVKARKYDCVFRFVLRHMASARHAPSRHNPYNHMTHMRELAWLWYREHDRVQSPDASTRETAPRKECRHECKIP
jgi:hypothetical protein